MCVLNGHHQLQHQKLKNFINLSRIPKHHFMLNGHLLSFK